ncbi:hypothetical protein LUZ60_001987 [Juncus effusus]|nr:hypothetical protein LUZ60_001987 [Juncus effusus]
MKKSFCSSLIATLVLFFFEFNYPSLVKAQSDSCGSTLAIGNLIPFSTASLTCVNAWSSENFILRHGQNGPNTWSFILSSPDKNAYIAIGFSSNGRMVGSDAIAGWISSNGGPGIVKQYSLGSYSSSSCKPDSGSLPLIANSSLIVSQSSTLYLAFQLNTSQPQWPHLIYAMGPSGGVPSSGYLPQHSNQASSSINYATGTVSGAGGGGPSKAKWHGFFVGLGWGILVPIGIIMARYFKHHDPFWFYAHISIQGVGFVFGLIGILIGFSLDDTGASNEGVHGGIGIAILVFGVLQVKAFFIRPNKSSKIRRYWNWYHHNIGRIALILGIVNIFLGLNLANESTVWTLFYGIFVAIWGLSCIFLEIKLWWANRD